MTGEEQWAELLRLEAVLRQMKSELERRGFSEESKPEVRKAEPQKDPEEVPEETRRKCAVGLLEVVPT